MTQRGSGEAPYPPDDGLEQRRVGNGRMPSQPSARRSGGSTVPEPRENWDADPFDSQELDRYLEDRARHIDPPRSGARSSTSADSARRDSGSRWSSSSRRPRRGAAPARQDEGGAPPSRPTDSASLGTSRPLALDHELAGDLGDGALSDLDDNMLDAGYEEPVDPYPAHQPSRRTRHYTARPRPNLVMPKVRVPGSVARADILQDSVALGLLGASALVALVMALVTASRVGDLPSVIELRYDASGFPSRWGPPKSLWQLPLLVAMVILINLVLAVALSRFDRFASRFLLAASLVIGLLTWVPVARFLW